MDPVERLNNTKETLTVTEAAKILGISRNGAYEAARRGELPILVIGRRILVSRRRLDRLLDGVDASSELA